MTFEEIHDKITMGQYDHPRFEVTPKLSSSYIIDENQTEMNASVGRNCRSSNTSRNGGVA